MTANKKLLFVAHTGQLSSGGEISNYQLMDYLVRQGYEIQIIHPDWNDVSYEEKMRAIGVQPVTISYTHWRDEDIRFEEVDLKAINQICEVIRSFNPGVVITNTMIVPWGAIAAALMNKPHMWVTREFPIGELVYLNEKKDIIKKFSNIVIANSRELADSVSIAYDVRAPYFYSYVDVKDIHLDDSITQTRFVSPNNIIPRKNQKELIEALAIVKERNPDFSTQVVLIGNKDETYWKSVKKLIVDNGLDSLVIVHEFSKEPWGLVGKSDILVQTSLSESIGRTTTDAMKIGI
ncbi:MAG TPA: glycosyltransferase family 4 protein, partial [Candidatus Babeliaceae bacterium]|nr:glycosyltransferase family 4 protein [Candidatus Babeliaceae bacterium]